LATTVTVLKNNISKKKVRKKWQNIVKLNQTTPILFRPSIKKISDLQLFIPQITQVFCKKISKDF
jgi:hypothetical protein